MKNLRIYISLFICMLATSIAFAAPRSKEQALAIAKNKLGKAVSVSLKKTMQKAPSATRPADEPCYYVFSAQNEKGFCVVSGDDRFPEIVAYSDEGSLDMDNLPPAVEAFFKTYKATMENLPEGAMPITRKASSVGAIEPLFQSNGRDIRWDQGYPWNLRTPEGYNKYGNYVHCPTGCAATAFAMILAYWKCPSQIKQEISGYTLHKYLYNTITEETKRLDFPAISMEEGKYNWDIIGDNSSQINTQVKRDETSKLMIHVCTKLQMGFTPDGSGANFLPEDFVDYFGYDPDIIAYIRRENMGIDKWTEIFDNELKEGRPIPMAGFSVGSGHAFVCDGVNDKGLYHINWGWGGGSNGFFDLAVLNPESTDGIGATSTSDGYSGYNYAVVGVRPDNGVKDEPLYDVSVETKRVVMYEATTLGTTGSSTYVSMGHVPEGEPFTGEFSAGYVEEDGTVVNCCTNNFSVQGLSGGHWFGLQKYTLNPSKFEEGRIYIVSGIYREKGASVWDYCGNHFSNYVMVKKENGNLKVVDNYLSLTDAYLVNNKITTYTYNKVNIEVNNPTQYEYYGQVFFHVRDNDVEPTDPKNNYDFSFIATFAPNRETTVGVTFRPTNTGDKYAFLYNKDGELIGKKRISKRAHLSWATDTPTYECSTQGIVSNATKDVNRAADKYTTIIYDNKVKLTFHINNDGEEHTGKFLLWKFNPAKGNLLGYYKTYTIKGFGKTEITEEFEGNIGDLCGGGLSSADDKFPMPMVYHMDYLAGPITKDGITFVSDGNTAIIKDIEGDGAVDFTADGIALTTPKGTELSFGDIDKTLLEEKFVGTNRFIHVIKSEDLEKIYPTYHNVTYINPADKDKQNDHPMELVEGQPYLSDYRIYSRNISYVHDVSNQWESICVPFRMTSTALNGKYEIKEVDVVNSTNLEVALKDVTMMEAGKPYLIRYIGNEDSRANLKSSSYVTNTEVNTINDDISFIGVFTKTQKFDAASIDRNNYTYYGLVSTPEGMVFKKAGVGAYVTPFHAYLRVRNNSASAPEMLTVIDGNGGTNGIVNVPTSADSELDDAPVYNLSGQRVTTFTPGIYVKNGKKFVVK